MIKTLKNTVTKKVTQSDDKTYDSSYTVIGIKFYDDRKSDSVELYLSRGSIVYWGDGAEDHTYNNFKRSGDPSRGDYLYRHKYSREFIDSLEGQTLKIVIKGYPIRNIQSFNASPYQFFQDTPFDKDKLCEIYQLSSRTPKAEGLFYECKHLTRVPGNLFSGSQSKFKQCFAYSGLTAIPENLFDRAYRFSDFTEAFAHCDDLVTSNLAFNDKNEYIQNQFMGMFLDCKNLKTVNPDMFVNVQPYSMIDQMFSGCDSLTVPDDLFKNIKTDKSKAF